jgi:hypothetical protein
MGGFFKKEGFFFDGLFAYSPARERPLMNAVVNVCFSLIDLDAIFVWFVQSASAFAGRVQFAAPVKQTTSRAAMPAVAGKLAKAADFRGLSPEEIDKVRNTPALQNKPAHSGCMDCVL